MGGTTSTSKVVEKLPSSGDPRITRFVENLEENGVKTVEKADFVQYFSKLTHDFVGRLFDNAAATESSSSSSSPQVTRGCLSSHLQQLVSLTSSLSQTRFYLMLYRSLEKSKIEELDEFVRMAFIFSLSLYHISQPPFQCEDFHDCIRSVSENIHDKSIASAAEWVDRHCPGLVTAMHLLLLESITSTAREISNPTDIDLDIPDGSLLNCFWWWLLTCSLPSCYTEPISQKSPESPLQGSNHDKQVWSLLYSSREHGLSTNRFSHHVFAYKKPTVVLISCEQGHLYAVAADLEWREGTSPWGGQHCHLIQLLPSYAILEEGENMFVFNEKSRNIPKGLYMGRNSKNYTLVINDGLQCIQHPGGKDNVIDMEVWGCGGTSAKDEQSKQKKREMGDAERKAKVKLPGQWEENPDRLLLQWGGVKPSYADQMRMECSPDSAS